MSATLLFVHGTGVREVSYAATLELVESQVARHGLDLSVRGCFWGAAEGARLRAGGASIPGYDEAGGAQPSEEDQLLALWSVLYTDPFYELRLLRHQPTPVQPFGQLPAGVVLLQTIQAYVPSDEVAATIARLGPYVLEAITKIGASAELVEATATAPADPLEHRRAIARAIVAAALVAAEEAGRPPLDGAARDELVAAVTTDLHGFGLGVGEFLLRPVKGLAAKLITRKLVGDRGSISDAVAPTAGDILRFLAHGDGARSYVRDAITDCGPGPVYVLAHSLGGIICADLLIREALPEVAALITVGSQAPFMYEIGALPALSHPDPLPEHMPTWLNVYDRRDLLSYVGEPLFDTHVRDVRVDNGQPFPQSHSAYWANPALWAAIADHVL